MRVTGPEFRSPTVSTQWLADHLGGDDLLVLDASVLRYTGADGRAGLTTGHEQYLLTGHIPGAVFADLLDGLSAAGGAHRLSRPQPDRLAAEFGALGIGPDTAVVVYDSAVGQWAARVWWLLRSVGHDRAAVLDGGLKAWTTEGRATETGHVAPDAREFRAAPRPELWADKPDVNAVVSGDAEATLVCALPRAEFTGEAPTARRPGHIPGSLSIPAGALVDRIGNTLVDRNRLDAAFADAAAEHPVITYCAMGVNAAADALALTLLGRTDVAVYDGSLTEWAADPDAPLVIGAGEMPTRR